MTTAFAMRAYRQVESQGIPGEKLYLLGLDGILEYLRRAEGALKGGGDMAVKGESLGKAYRLVEHLLAALPEEGAATGQPDLGERLAGIYRYLLDRLAQANIFDDAQAVEDCRAVVTTLRESWQGAVVAAAD